jgi:hypothetical protein
VPYAYHADNSDKLGGIGSEGFVQVQPGISGQQITGTSSDTIINIDYVGSGSPDLIDLKIGGNSAFRVINNGDTYISGRLGVGIENPTEAVDVSGNIQLDGDILTTTPMSQESSYEWTNTVGGTSTDIGEGISVDSSGNVYTTGYFQGTVDFDPGAGVDNKTSVGSYDIFVTKYDSSGNYQWTKIFGGTGNDEGLGISVDSSGNVYTTGYFRNTVDFDPGAGVDNRTSAGSSDIFVTKYDSSGNYQWTNTVGGTSTDEGLGISVDSSGNVYTTGYFWGTVDFDPGAGVDNRTSTGNSDIFVTKYDASGSYQWTNTVGGTNNDRGEGISVDSSGNVYTTGYFRNTVDFDPGAGVDNRTSAGFEDIFVTKYDASGNYQWTNTVGGTSSDYSQGISVDSSGNVYTTGWFGGTVDFDPGAGVDNKTSAGSWDIFVTKYDASGSYQWTNTVGGTSTDIGYGISVDSSGNVYTTGYFWGTVDFDPGAGVDNKTSAGGYDIFVTKYGASGNYQWTNTVGGSSFDEGWGITVDSSGNVYTTGYFQGTADFDPGAGVDNKTSAGSADIFVTKYSQEFSGSDIGTSTNPFANVYAGRYNGKELNISNFDVAEEYEVLDESIGPGDVVRFMKDNDGNELLVERAVSSCSSTAAGSSPDQNDSGSSDLFGSDDCRYDNSVVGVISTEPGLYLKDWEKNKSNGRPVALVGRVPVKVTLENGPIERGDYLVASSTPGYAMKATKGGMIVGRAMEDFNPTETKSSGDSPIVKKHLEEVEKEIDEVLEVVTESADKENGGKVRIKPELENIDPDSVQEEEKSTEEVKEEVEEIKEKITQESETSTAKTAENSYGSQSAESSEEVSAGRVMMYVDLSYVSDEAFFNEQKVLGAIDVNDLTLENGNKLFDIVNNNGSTKLVTGGDLEVQGTLATNVITTADITDLTIQLNENTALQVINQEEETVFAVDDSGKISLREGEGSSLGSVTIPAGETEIFVNSNTITSNSSVFLTSANSKVTPVENGLRSGEGFTITIRDAQPDSIRIDYLVIN